MIAFLLFCAVYPGYFLTAVFVPLLSGRWFTIPERRKETEWLLVGAVMMQPLSALSHACANACSYLRPMKLDLYVCRFDQHFGSPSFVLGQLIAAHRWLHIVVSVSYGLLPVMMFLVIAVYLRACGGRVAAIVTLTFVLNAFLALPIYLLFPVSGPGYAFSCFPLLPASVAPHMIAIAAAPNGLPSVHTSTALIILWLLRGWPLGRIVGVLFFLLTVLATLSSGEHYLLDLLCALPYTALILWITYELASRWKGIAKA